MIIVEGADNSGKTTFAKSLSTLSYHSAGPAPKDHDDLIRCLTDQMGRATMPCVQDRLTCISQQVYWNDAPVDELQADLAAIMSVPGVVVVYCRPPERTLMDMSTHKVKSYETEENVQNLIRMQHEFVRRYDDLMGKIVHIQYDWTDYDESDNRNFRSLLVASQHSVDEWKKLMDMARTKWFYRGVP